MTRDDVTTLTANPADVDPGSVAALLGDEDVLGVLDRYKVEIVQDKEQVDRPFIVWRCQEGCGPNGTAGVIARDLKLDQTNLTLGELVDAALRHAEEEHGEDYGRGDTDG